MSLSRVSPMEREFRNGITALRSEHIAGLDEVQLVAFRQRKGNELEKMFDDLVRSATGETLSVAQAASRIVFSSINGEIKPPHGLVDNFQALAVRACARVAAQDTNLSQNRGNECLAVKLNNFELCGNHMATLTGRDASAVLLPLCDAFTHVIRTTKSGEYQHNAWRNLETIVLFTAAKRLPNQHAARVMGYGVASMAELALHPHLGFKDRVMKVYDQITDCVQMRTLHLPAWLCAQLQGEPEDVFARRNQIIERADYGHPAFL